MAAPFRHPLAATAALGSLVLLAGTAAAAVVPEPIVHASGGAALALTPLGTYDTGTWDEAAAEIVAYHAGTQRTFVVNALAAEVEVLDASDPTAPESLFTLQTTGITAADGSTIPAHAEVNSVAVRADGLGVAAVENDPKTDAGWLVFFDAAGEGSALGAVRIGAQPDMVAISPDGATAVLANEGEPEADYSVDPEGTISVVKLPDVVEAPGQSAVATADFHAFEGNALPDGVRIFGGRADAGTGSPEFPVSENLEPEYVTIDQQSKTAYVTLQEANAVAVVNLASAAVTDIWALGTIDRMDVPMDASNDDGGINIRTWPVQTFPQPDGIAAFQVRGKTYLITANEGDARDYDAYSEEARVRDLGEDGLPPICASVVDEFNAATGEHWTLKELQAKSALGRLNITTAQGLSTDGSCYETLYGFGGRGFSIYSPGGDLVSTSGSEFEQITAEALPESFNANNTDAGFDSRSDDKGPEPEGVTVGRVGGSLYAFVTLERVGGIMVYDVTQPASPEYVTYVNNRDFGYDDGLAAGDSAPEGIDFVAAEESPTGAPMLVVGNEVSGSTTFFEIERVRR